MFGGASLVGTSLLMATGVDHGFTADFPVWAKNLWATGLIFVMLAGVVLALNGAGLLTNDTVAVDPAGEVEPSNRTLRLKHFLTVYIGFLFSVTFFAFLIEDKFSIAVDATIQIACGALFIAASFRRPWWLYATLRRLGWFSAIFSDKWMRRVLVGLGAILIVSGTASARRRTVVRDGETYEAAADRLLEGEPQRVLPKMEVLVREAPDNAYVAQAFAGTLMRVGRYSEALAEYERTLNLGLRDANTFGEMAIVLYLLGRQDEARMAFGTSLKLNDNDARVHNNYGLLLRDIGDLPGAHSHFEKAVNIDSLNGMALGNLGVSFVTLNRYNEAEALLRRSVRASPDVAYTQFALAEVLRMLGRPRHAAPFVCEALRLEPEQDEYKEAVELIANELDEPSLCASH